MEAVPDKPRTDEETLRLAIARLDAGLAQRFEFRKAPLGPNIPADAGLTLSRIAASTAAAGPNAAVSTQAGSVAQFAVELRRRVDASSLPGLAARAELIRTASSRLAPLVVAPYIPPLMQERLARMAINFADTTGNLLIAQEDPLILLRQTGASTDPWRGPGRPSGNMRGGPAASVARALADFAANELPVTKLVSLACTSTGPTYRVVAYLQAAGALAHEPRGPIRNVDWRQVLEFWARDYSFLHDNDVRRYVAPRGVDGLAAQLAKRADTDYVITGSLAAQQYAPYAPARAGMIYARDPDAIADALGLTEVDSGANVLLATPKYEVVFERAKNVDDAMYAAPSQVFVDLQQAAGRGPAEAQNLMSWMESNPDAWRRSTTD